MTKLSIYNIGYERNRYPDRSYEPVTNYTIVVESASFSDAQAFLLLMMRAYGGNIVVDYNVSSRNGHCRVSGLPVKVSRKEKILA